MDNYQYYYFDNKTICIITDINTGEKFVGEATWDGTGTYNQAIGENIASKRAIINSLRTYREAARLQYKNLQIMLTDMAQRKDFDPKSYEVKQIKKLMWDQKATINELNSFIRQDKNALHFYIGVRCK